MDDSGPGVRPDDSAEMVRMLVSEMPHGGVKLSGYGKDMSMYGLEDYTAVRHVMFKH